MNKEIKHTPGPWHVRDAPYGFDIFTRFFAEDPPQWVAAITLPLVSMTERERLGMYPPRPVCEANAVLIAAAPEIFDLLKEAHVAVGFLALTATSETNRVNCNDLVERIDAALTKIKAPALTNQGRLDSK